MAGARRCTARGHRWRGLSAVPLPTLVSGPSVGRIKLIVRRCTSSPWKCSPCSLSCGSQRVRSAISSRRLRWLPGRATSTRLWCSWRVRRTTTAELPSAKLSASAELRRRSFRDEPRAGVSGLELMTVNVLTRDRAMLARQGNYGQ